MSTPPLAVAVDALAAGAERRLAGTPFLPAVAAARERLRQPLRVAIAGRTKAGKSTLLNALVGERLAPTDAGECTQIVTWFRHDLGYSVAARLKQGGVRALEFRRGTALEVRLGGLAVDEIDRLDVGWPSSRLVDLTLIDTPGLGSAAHGADERTMDALIGDAPAASDADAVIYLMRHLHRRDADFLEAFLDRSLATPSPVNAVALLSRADEIGGGRPDALASAARIAARYAADPRVRAVATGVIPLAGLLAETAVTLREDEVKALREVARLDDDAREAVLLSADRFRTLEANPLPADARDLVLDRFGMFGTRAVVGLLRARPELSAEDVSRALIRASGIEALQAVIRDRFASRAATLKARSGLGRLGAIASEASRSGLREGDDIRREVERLAASSQELAHLRVLHLVLSGAVPLDEDERREIDRLVGTERPAVRLGLPADVSTQEALRTALSGIDRWRTRAAHPLTQRPTAEAADTIARAYEGLYQEVAAGT